MSKRADTLETTILAIEILRRIPRARKVTAAELHEQITNAGIERDLRTVQRQLEKLCGHYDIECDDRSKPYGYRWKEHAGGLSLPVLGEQEALLLLLAEEHLSQFLPGNVMKALQSFFLQAHSKLGPANSGTPVQQWLKKVCVVSPTQPLLPPKIDDAVFDAVSNALYANRWLDVEYRNAAGHSKQKCVMPLGLAQQGVRLFLVCRYDGYDNERILALHRITAARVTNKPFEYPSDFDLAQYDAEGSFGFGDGRRVRLSFSIDKDTGLHLTESPLSEDQVVVAQDGHLDITATVVETLQLHRWLLGFGRKVWDVRMDAVEAGQGQDESGLRHILS